MKQGEIGVNFNLCIFNCKLKRKKLVGKQSRYLYVFDEYIVINQDQLKQKLNRMLQYQMIKRIVWNYAKHKKNKQIYLKSFCILIGKDELKYYGEEDILIALKRILAKYVFQAKVQDEYEAQTLLGEGSYATVMTLRHLHSQFKFAGKCIEKKKLEKIDNGMLSVLNEIHIMRVLSPHSQIVNLHEVYDGDNNIYLVLDLCEGGSLLSEMKERENLFQKQDIKIIMFNLLSALEYIHSKDIMHRDLKPDNILFQRKKDYSTLKLADFGLSAFYKKIPYLYPKCGTPGYVAPEVANLIDKSSGYHSVCDIFSCGVIFHLLLMGEGVFPGKGHVELLKKNKECDIDPSLVKYDILDPITKDILFMMLKQNPNHRPSALQCLDHPYFTNLPMIKQEIYSLTQIKVIDASSIIMQDKIIPIENEQEIQARLSVLSLQKQSIENDDQ